MSSSSNALTCGRAGFFTAELELPVVEVCIDVSTDKFMWGSRPSGRVERRLPESAVDIWSESMVVRNGATVRGILGLPWLLSLGGPWRMKSISSEDDRLSLWTTASRA